jgi:adenylate cyclase, class 2
MNSQPENWEVELKFHGGDVRDLERRLTELGFCQTEFQRHEDTYWRHPCRDFKHSDEALRIRRLNDRAYVTYKGPRQTGSVKTREEIDLDIDLQSLERWKTLIDRLGFQPVPPVRKTRRVFESDRSEYSAIIVVLDAVEGLGEFVEIESIVTENSALEAAKSRILTLSRLLELDQVEPRSYLDQLLSLKEK